jgi:undecaprenyl-diphosphatase
MPTVADPSDPSIPAEAPASSHGAIKRLVDWDTRVSHTVSVDWPHPRWLTWPLGLLSLTANYGILWFVLAAAAALLAADQRPAHFVYVAGAVLVTEMLTFLVKLVFRRRRPPERDPGLPQHIPMPLSPSFPSSHASMGVVGAVAMAHLHPPWWPLLAALTAALGFSRVYLRVHFLLDVLAGLALGAVLGLLLIALPGVG